MGRETFIMFIMIAMMTSDHSFIIFVGPQAATSMTSLLIQRAEVSKWSGMDSTTREHLLRDDKTAW